MKFIYAEGATPLELDEIQNILPQHISTQKELDEVEAENIIQAQQWAFSRRRTDIFTVPFILKVHKKMFGNVWKWAGKYRTCSTNIGVEPYRVPFELSKLLEDTKFWIQHSTYSLDEIAARFHHKLVWIHAFPNGNGRHARLMANLLLYQYSQPVFSWGRSNLTKQGTVGKIYIEALRAADKNNIVPLLKFVRS